MEATDVHGHMSIAEGSGGTLTGVWGVQVPEDRAVGDPPLLRLESEASHAYLSVLLTMIGASPTADQPAADSASQHLSPDVVRLPLLLTRPLVNQKPL